MTITALGYIVGGLVAGLLFGGVGVVFGMLIDRLLGERGPTTIVLFVMGGSGAIGGLALWIASLALGGD